MQTFQTHWDTQTYPQKYRLLKCVLIFLKLFFMKENTGCETQHLGFPAVHSNYYNCQCEASLSKLKLTQDSRQITALESRTRHNSFKMHNPPETLPNDR